MAASERHDDCCGGAVHGNRLDPTSETPEPGSPARLIRGAWSAFWRVIAPDVETLDPALAMYVRRMNSFILILGTIVLGIALTRFAEGAHITATIEVSAIALMLLVRTLALHKPSVQSFYFAGKAGLCLGVLIIVGTALMLG